MYASIWPLSLRPLALTIWQAKGRPFMALKMIKFSHYRSNCAKVKPQNGWLEREGLKNPSHKIRPLRGQESPLSTLSERIQ